VTSTLEVHGSGQPLAEHLGAHFDALASDLLKHGGLLLKGFAPWTAADFRAAVGTFVGEFLDTEGEHVPVKGQERVFNPVRYAPEQVLLWHNENSFNVRWPEIISFGCVRPAERGGESLLVDSRTMLRQLNPDIVAEFKARGVQYVRRMGNGLGRHWRDILAARTKAEAEQRCRAQDCAFRWLSGDVLETTAVRQATVVHPITGEESWFNQVQHWHQRCLTAEDREAMLAMLGEKGMPRDCRFGDCGRIPDDVVDHILKTYAANEVAIACRAGDVLILDNVAMAHGRSHYVGKRELLVAMGQRHTACSARIERSLNVGEENC
jgi:alpha-ketoglutarate-dependent taurine dioxygenase